MSFSVFLFFLILFFSFFLPNNRHKETVSRRVDHLWDRAKSASFSAEEKLTLRQQLDEYKELEVNHLHDRLTSKKAFHQVNVQEPDLWTEEGEEEEDISLEQMQLEQRLADHTSNRLSDARRHEKTRDKIRSMRRNIETQIREKERM